jgi:hypothetical protein
MRDLRDHAPGASVTLQSKGICIVTPPVPVWELAKGRIPTEPPFCYALEHEYPADIRPAPVRQRELNHWISQTLGVGPHARPSKRV